MANKRIKDLTAETTVQSGDYVELDRAAYGATHKITVSNLTALEQAAREAQDNVIEAAGGLKTDGTYGVSETTSINTFYLRSADFAAGGTDRSGEVNNLTPSLKSADRLLDMKLKETVDRVTAMENATVNVSIQLTHAEILTLNSSPVKVIDISTLPNYSAGKAFVLTAWEWTFANGTTPYATNTTLAIYTTSSPFAFGTSGAALVSEVARTGKGALQDDACLGGFPTDAQISSDDDVYISVLNGDPTGGAIGQTLTLYLHGVLVAIS